MCGGGVSESASLRSTSAVASQLKKGKTQPSREQTKDLGRIEEGRCTHGRTWGNPESDGDAQVPTRASRAHVRAVPDSADARDRQGLTWRVRTTRHMRHNKCSADDGLRGSGMCFDSWQTDGYVLVSTSPLPRQQPECLAPPHTRDSGVDGLDACSTPMAPMPHAHTAKGLWG